MGQFEKGRKKTGGRKRGSENRVTSDVKAMVHEALHEVGGVDYLARQAKANPKAFLALLGRTLPKEQKTELIQTVRISMLGIRDGGKPEKKSSSTVQPEIGHDEPITIEHDQAEHAPQQV